MKPHCQIRSSEPQPIRHVAGKSPAITGALGRRLLLGVATAALLAGVNSTATPAKADSGSPTQYWDGADSTGNGIVDGGSGTWNATADNWTDAAGDPGSNGTWQGFTGVFSGASGGQVSVDGTALFDVLRFTTDGYAISGDELQLAPQGAQSVIDVYAGVSTTIVSGIVDGGNGHALVKTGGGTLVLSGYNTYSGDTIVQEGRLVAGTVNVFSPVSNLIINDGIVDIGRNGQFITGIGGDGGTLILDEEATDSGAGYYGTTITVSQNHDSVFAGHMQGNLNQSRFTKAGTGTLELSGTGNLRGYLTVQKGTLSITGVYDVLAGREVWSLDGGTATLNVSGPNARLNTASNDTVGERGTGTMNVSGGALVKTWNSYIGNWDGGNGTLNVTGEYTRYELSNSMRIGGRGTGRLEVSDGAVMQGNDSWIQIGYDQGSDGSAVVTGANSLLGGADRIKVGEYGTGSLTVADGGTVQTDRLMIAVETWNGIDSVGTVNIGAAFGGTAVGAGTVQAGTVTFGDGVGTLNFNHNSTGYTFAAPMSGDGMIDHLAGKTSLTGDSSGFTGTTHVSGGTLSVDGTLGGAVEVGATGTLGGTGQIGGSVDLDGTLAAGSSPGTLTIGGNLILGATSKSLFELGAPGVIGGTLNDFIDVGGDLSLGGTLDAMVSAAGYYRLFDYAGSLTGAFASQNVASDGGGFVLDSYQLVTDHAGEVTLLALGAGQFMQFWDGADTTGDGAVNGGAGTWSASLANWTGAPGAAGINDVWHGSVAVFAGATGGDVTVDGEASFDTLQFSTDGYRISGDDMAIRPASGDTGTIRVDGGVSATIASAIIDGGNDFGLTKTGSGTLVLEGDNRYGGGTTISGGTLQGDTESLAGDIVNNATLSFDQNFDGEYAGVLGGTGTFDKRGEGTLRLIGDSSGFAGSTHVENGTLRIDGSLGGLIRVEGGMLSGIGTMNQLVVSNGGTFAPGNSIGTANAGDLTFDAGSTYEVEVNDAGSTAGVNNDITIATGTATIDGDASVYVKPVNGTDDGSTYVLGTTYTILTAAGGVDGEFNPTVIDDFSLLDGSLSYGTNVVYLTLNKAIQLDDVGRSTNQISVGAALEAIGSGDPVYDTLIMVSGENDVRTGLDSLSGEVHASLQTVLVSSSTMLQDAIGRRMDNAFEQSHAVSTYGANLGGSISPDVAGEANRAAFWMQGFGASGQWDGDDNASGLERLQAGSLMGFEAMTSGGWLFGLMGGYSQSRFDIDERASSGMIENYHAGVYGAGDLGALALRFGGSLSWHEIETSRTVAYPGFNNTLTADYDAASAQVFGEAGFRFNTAMGVAEPFAGLSLVHLHTAGFSERGGAGALHVDRTERQNGFLTLGIRGDGDAFLANGVETRLTGSLAWRHAVGDVTPNAQMSFSGGGDFSVSGLAVERDVALIDIGADMKFSPLTSLDLGYRGQIGVSSQDHGISAAFSMRF